MTEGEEGMRREEGGDGACREGQSSDIQHKWNTNTKQKVLVSETGEMHPHLPSRGSHNANPAHSGVPSV